LQEAFSTYTFFTANSTIETARIKQKTNWALFVVFGGNNRFGDSYLLLATAMQWSESFVDNQGFDGFAVPATLAVQAVQCERRIHCGT